MRSALCGPCQAASDAWLDYRLTPSIKIASGSSRDDTVAGVADARKARHQEWKDTINRQQAIIRAQCEAAGHGSEQGVDNPD